MEVKQRLTEVCIELAEKNCEQIELLNLHTRAYNSRAIDKLIEDVYTSDIKVYDLLLDKMLFEGVNNMREYLEQKFGQESPVIENLSIQSVVGKVCVREIKKFPMDDTKKDVESFVIYELFSSKISKIWFV